MSEPSTTRSGRMPALAPTVGIFAILILAFMLFSKVWTDYLWFTSVDAQEVFLIQLGSKAGLFLVFALLMAMSIGINMLVVLKFRPPSQTSRSGLLDRFAQFFNQRKAVAIGVPALIAGILFGVSATNYADTFLAWWNRTPFGTEDPYFHLDTSFFIFDLPWWQAVVTSVLWILLLTLILVAAAHFITGSLSSSPVRFIPPSQAGQSPEFEVSNPFGARAQAHLSVLLGLIMVVVAVDQFLARYTFAISDNDALFTGIGYTDDNSRITAKLIVAIICLVCAVIFFVNAKLKRWILPVSAVALAVASSLILQVAYPGIVQQFQVRPNEPDKERPYIANQIEATNEAYGLSDVEIQDYKATTTVTAGQLIEDASALPGIRLMDPQVIAPTFEQLQQVRGYYSFPEVLDVDRYTIDDQETDAIIAVREIDTNGLPEENRSWNNMHTVYTHGYAMVGAYGNRRQPSGEPDWIVRDIPPVGAIEQAEPRVYFGEKTTSYSIVGAEDGGTPVELDTPGGDEASGKETYTSYTGKGGVHIGSPIVRALFAARFGDINLLLSDRVNSESRILFDRTPAERVAKVAPWLNIDQDPFPAIVDGRASWILDGYTTSNSYPNSQRVNLEETTSDSISNWTSVGAPRKDVNYMRNSVKAVVDAYDGTVTLYAWDTDDPLLQTWQKVYPGTLHSVDEISDDLMNHLRYPQDLFKVQRQILSRYHMTDPMAWYQQSDLWRIPVDPRSQEGNETKEPPYYLSIKWPGDDRAIFSQTAVFVPNERENLGAYMAVVADAAHENYGKIRVLKLSDTHQVPGPNQTYNAIQSDDRVQQSLLPFTSQGAAEPVYGNLLTLPIGGGLIYVNPIYTQSKTSASYPVLRFIVVRFGDHIGIGETLQSALDMVFEGDAGVTTDEGEMPEETTTPSDQPTSGSDAAKALLAEAADAFSAADQAMKDGDLGEYQKQVDIARDKLKKADSALG